MIIILLHSVCCALCACNGSSQGFPICLSFPPVPATVRRKLVTNCRCLSLRLPLRMVTKRRTMQSSRMGKAQSTTRLTTLQQQQLLLGKLLRGTATMLTHTGCKSRAVNMGHQALPRTTLQRMLIMPRMNTGGAAAQIGMQMAAGVAADTMILVTVGMAGVVVRQVVLVVNQRTGRLSLGMGQEPGGLLQAGWTGTQTGTGLGQGPRGHLTGLRMLLLLHTDRLSSSPSGGLMLWSCAVVWHHWQCSHGGRTFPPVAR